MHLMHCASDEYLNTATLKQVIHILLLKGRCHTIYMMQNLIKFGFRGMLVVIIAGSPPLLELLISDPLSFYFRIMHHAYSPFIFPVGPYHIISNKTCMMLESYTLQLPCILSVASDLF